MSDKSPPSFRSTFQKTARARKLLAEIEAVLAEYESKVWADIRVEGGAVLFVARIDEPPPGELSLLIGDFLHNLRSALDHLVYECNGKPGDRSCQFPVWTKGKDRFNVSVWRHEVKGRMKEPGAKALRDLLADVEAYEGGEHEFLWHLHELDIIDKHRLLLTAVAAASEAWFEAEVEMTTDAPTGEPLDTLTVFVDPNSPLELEKQGRIKITLQPEHSLPLKDGTVVATWPGPGVSQLLRGGLEFAVILQDPQPEPNMHYALPHTLRALADDTEQFLSETIAALGSKKPTSG